MFSFTFIEFGSGEECSTSKSVTIALGNAQIVDELYELMVKLGEYYFAVCSISNIKLLIVIL